MEEIKAYLAAVEDENQARYRRLAAIKTVEKAIQEGRLEIETHYVVDGKIVYLPHFESEKCVIRIVSESVKILS